MSKVIIVGDDDLMGKTVTSNIPEGIVMDITEPTPDILQSEPIPIYSREPLPEIPLMYFNHPPQIKRRCKRVISQKKRKARLRMQKQSRKANR